MGCHRRTGFAAAVVAGVVDAEAADVVAADGLGPAVLARAG